MTRSQFGHGTDDGEHGPAHQAAGIDLILEADETDAEEAAASSA